MAERIPFPKHLLNVTYRTIRNAFDRSDKPDYMIMEEGYPGNVNISSILTRILQEAGRFSEAYTSDVLYDLDTLRTLAGNEYPLDEDIDEIYTFGIRRHGVDGNNFVMSRLIDTMRPLSSYLFAESQYRKILAVRVTAKADRDEDGYPIGITPVRFQLKDLTDAFHALNFEDVDDKRRLLPLS